MNPFRVRIIHYAEHVRDMFDLAKYLPPPSMKGNEYDQADWAVQEKQLSEYVIRVATKDWLLKSIQDEMEDKGKKHWSFTHKEWCNFMSTMKEKDNRKRYAAQIKKTCGL